MAEKGWTAVEKPDWETDVGIVKELNAALTLMNGATSFEALAGYYERQRENAKYLMPEGRKKWEAAYATNVLRLVAPPALRPDRIWVAVVAEQKSPGVFAYGDTRVYTSESDAVRATIRGLILAGDFYENMPTEGVQEVAAAVADQNWHAAYEAVRRHVRGLLVSINPGTIDEVESGELFTLSPKMGTAPAPPLPWPYTPVRHSAIEYRHGDGGKGDRGVYLVAEQEELSVMLRGAGKMTAGEVAGVFTRIADRLEQDATRGTEAAALAAWREYVEEMADEEDDG